MSKTSLPKDLRPPFRRPQSVVAPVRLQPKRASARSPRCEHSPDARSRLAQRERPQCATAKLQRLERAKLFRRPLRLALTHWAHYALLMLIDMLAAFDVAVLRRESASESLRRLKYQLVTPRDEDDSQPLGD